MHFLLIVSILIAFLDCVTVSLDVPYLLLLFCYFQETLLVHEDLVQNARLNELIVDLQIEGWTFLANHFPFLCKIHFGSKCRGRR